VPHLRNRSAARVAAAGLALAGALVAPLAAAQEIVLPVIGGGFEVASGVEGGGKGHAAGVRRARTSLRVGGELGLAETPGPNVGAGLLLEIEPHTSVGADLRYIHILGDRFALHAGALAMFAPSTLIGASAGAEVRLRLHRVVSLTAGPTFQAFFTGSDLPENNVIWQGLFHVGFNFRLR